MAATYTIGPERIIDSAIATLSSGIGAALATVQGGTTDGLVLASPVEIVAGIRRTVPAYPTFEVAMGDEGAADPSVQWGDAEATGPLVVGVHVEDAASVERVYRRMMRYSAAVRKVLVVPGALGAGVAVERVRVAYRVDPETREVQERVGFVAVAFELGWVDRY